VTFKAGSNKEQIKRPIVVMGKVFDTGVAAAEAMGLDPVTFKVQLHFWNKGEHGGKPPWFIEIKPEDAENQEMIDAAVTRTGAAARRLYDLKFRVIQEDYDKRMAVLNKEYKVLRDDNEAT